MQSITKHSIITRGVFVSETNPRQVIALVEFDDAKDQDTANAKIGEYASSEAFKKDMGEEVSMGDFEGVEANFVRPTEFSPRA